LLLTLMALSLAGAFVSGLVGVGGAIVMIPLLLYVPPLLGVGRLDLKSVAAITMVQVFVAAASGMLAHSRRHAARRALALGAGPAGPAPVGGRPRAAGSPPAAILSPFADERPLRVVLGLMTLSALVILSLPAEPVGPPLFAECEPFDRPRATAVCGGVGLAA